MLVIHQKAFKIKVDSRPREGGDSSVFQGFRFLEFLCLILKALLIEHTVRCAYVCVVGGGEELC